MDYDAFELFGDAIRYDILSDNILKGDHNLDITAFITPPLYVYTVALSKLIFSSQWTTAMTVYHFFLISVSAVYVYKIASCLFNDKTTAWMAAVFYIFYPLTLWYNFTLSQEASFQSFFIIFCYYFIMALRQNSSRYLVYAALFLVLAFLTKSHIMLLLFILPAIIYLKAGFKSFALFISCLSVFLAPKVAINYQQYGVYSISDYGAGSFFLAGHSSVTFPCLTSEIKKHPEIIEEGCDLNIIFHPPYHFENYGQVNTLPLPERNRLRFLIAWDWIKANPAKFLRLKWNAFKRFLLPGLDHRYYDPLMYWTSLIIGLLIYIPAYYGLYLYRQKKVETIFFISLILLIAAIFIIFYPQNRFRVITVEPMLIIFSAWTYRNKLLDPLLNRWDLDNAHHSESLHH